MGFFIIDVEADAPSPMTGSMVSFGAVRLDRLLDKNFYGQTAPISDFYNPEALAVSGHKREEHLKFDDPEEVMLKFREWVLEVNHKGRPQLISDNNGFDAMWITCYFDKYGIENPFGWSSKRIGDIYAGFKNNFFDKWKHLKDTRHTHHPVDDAMGNAEALLKMVDMGLKLKV